MERSKRQATAEETLQILEAGAYTSLDTETNQETLINISQVLEASKAGTILYLPNVDFDLPPPTDPDQVTEVYLSNETTLECTKRLSLDEGCENIAALNFASAKNPGGGFKRGAWAQEESLAACSGLYSCLTTDQAKPYYELHNKVEKVKDPIRVYTSNIIFSPNVPVFRDDTPDFEGNKPLLGQPYTCSIITSCAVNFNTGITARKITDEQKKTPLSLLNSRALRILQIALHHKVETIVLGAWGCGVFKNDPNEIARAFAGALSHPQIENRFKQVIFAIPDKKNSPNYKAFAKIFKEREVKK